MARKIWRQTVAPQNAGEMLGSYLKRVCGFTRAQIRSMKFRPDGIVVNGRRARVNTILCAGDELELCLETEERTSDFAGSQGNVGSRKNADSPGKAGLPGNAGSQGNVGSQRGAASAQLRILYEDEDLIAVWKKAGQVTHPAHGHYSDTLSNLLHTYFEEKGEKNVIRSIGRLDKDTSGIVVFAKNQVAAQRLWQQKKQGIFRKEYLALCEGSFLDGAWRKIDAPIAPAPGELMKMCVSAEGKPAVTYYQVMEQYETCALLRVRIATGRTHQIRVHMASIGHPLVGDALYGGGAAGGIPANCFAEASGARLCAWRAWLRQPFTGEEIELGEPGIF